ncbi:hypothetical protein D6829_02660 [Candidatus Pacearchaeota archaeon]|nr:MAG: hypothetical protein D6829_02660 [Candidatus Pacearchaeota archaeon]
MAYSVFDMEKRFEVDLEEIILKLKKFKGKQVLFQFPDGLKVWAVPFVEFVEEKTGILPRIWLGDCFGACDIPKSSCDVLVQFGHAPWNFGFDGSGVGKVSFRKI